MGSRCSRPTTADTAPAWPGRRPPRSSFRTGAGRTRRHRLRAPRGRNHPWFDGKRMTMAKIIIVEDNPANMELATDLLEPLGYVILPAGTAEEGIQLARHELPDLILMDVALPGMDGLSATQRLKGDPRTQRIPIVAL